MKNKPVVNALPLLAAFGSSLLLSSCITSESGDLTLFNTGSESFQISGLVSAEAATAVDSDVNDINADYQSNDNTENAQEISNLVTVQGFVSATGTDGLYSGSNSVERFSDDGDFYDYYALTLQAGQSVTLNIVDYSSSGGLFTGDLDLYLWDTDGNLISSSTSSHSTSETVSATETGSYYLQVAAYSGIAKYLLAVNATTSGIFNPAAEFVAGEVLIGYDSDVASASQFSAQLNSMSLSRSTMKVSSIKGGENGRPALISLTANSSGTTRQLGSSANTATQSSASDVQQKIDEQLATLIAIKELSEQDGVLYAEPNYIRQPFTTPNDTRYPLQWHYDNIDLPSAWELTDGTPDGGEDDVIVAVLDTGVYMSHSDLTDQLTDTGFDFVSSSSMSNDGDGIDDDPNDPGDSTYRGQSTWHGTHVAGTIAATTNNSRGVAGVSWGAKVMPVRVLGIGGGTSYDIIQGIYYAAGLDNDSGTIPSQAADIINMSLGSTSSSTAELTAVTAAYDAGVIIVAAAGNSGSSAKNYPASYEGVISVAATDYEHQYTSYSNYGNAVDIAAPGGDTSVDANLDGYPDGVYSTLVDDSTSTKRSTYGFYNGTSMASPHVAGVLALMKAEYPDLSPAQVDALIAGSLITDDRGDTGYDIRYGWGEINAFTAVTQAMALASGGTVDLPAIPYVSPSSVTIGTDETASVSLSNLGGDTLTVTSVTDDSDWMTVTEDDVDSNGLGSYLITIDRTDLPTGYYSGLITFVTDQGNREAEVVITVGDLSNTGELTRQYVLALDTAGNYVEETRASSLGIFSLELPAGEYYLYAGSDIDVDYYICTAGETCGSYPSLNNPSSITISSDRSDLNFSVRILDPGEAASAQNDDLNSVDESGIPRQNP